MTTYRPRGFSPPPPRRYEQSRASAGPVHSTAFDTRFNPPPPRISTDLVPAASRSGTERLYDAQPLSRRDYPAPDHAGIQSKTEYAVRPRHGPLLGDDGRPQYRGFPPSSPHRASPLINNFPHDRPRSPPGKRYHRPDDTDRYILPAVSGPRQHHRHLSETRADSAHLAPNSRDSRDRVGYRAHGPRVYPAARPPVRYDDEDAYSYTTPREQFDRDYPPPQPPPRRNSHLREDRPVIKPDLDDDRASSQRKRDSGPPPAVRQLHKLGDKDLRHSGRSENHSDTERDSHSLSKSASLRLPSSTRRDRNRRYSPDASDSSRQKNSRSDSRLQDDEPSYSSDRENSHSTRHYERHKYRPDVRQGSHERASKASSLATAGIGGLAATSLAGALVNRPRGKDDESDHADAHATRHRYGQDRDSSHDVRDKSGRESDYDVGDQPKDRERAARKLRDRTADLRGEAIPRERRREDGRKERSESDSIDDDRDGHRRRRKHRHQRRHSRPEGHESGSTSDDKRPEAGEELPQGRRERNVRHEGSRLSDRDRRKLTDRRHDASDEDERAPELKADPGEGDDSGERAARLQLVELANDKEPDVKPRGILKPARQVPFPEDPNPTREGVAPLKDAGKKGIPTGARWTKINRMLVNPAALEAAHERYEERSDYVIVLRVLSKEEIEQLSEQTKKIRESREAEARPRLEAKKQDKKRSHRRHDSNNNEGSDSSSFTDDDDDDNERRKPPLAIEPAPASAPPVPSGADHRYPSEMHFPNADDRGRSQPETDPTMTGLGIRA